MWPGRFDRARRLAALDPVTDRHVIARTLTEYEFPWDMMRSLELALFRTYAVPSIGALLYRTGQFAAAAQRRYDDTVLLLYEIWSDGPDSPRGRPAVARLNQLHGQYHISNADYLYTLATFVVMPVRWNASFGWRRFSPAEVAAWTGSMTAMGEAMDLTGIPSSYEEHSRLLDSYEAARFRYRPAGRAVADATLDLMASWWPRRLRRPVRWGATFLLDDHLLAALGLRRPPAVLRALARSGLRLRALLVRLGPPRPEDRPFRFTARSYPDGYVVDRLGATP